MIWEIRHCRYRLSSNHKQCYLPIKCIAPAMALSIVFNTKMSYKHLFILRSGCYNGYNYVLPSVSCVSKLKLKLHTNSFIHSIYMELWKGFIRHGKNIYIITYFCWCEHNFYESSNKINIRWLGSFNKFLNRNEIISGKIEGKI